MHVDLGLLGHNADAVFAKKWTFDKRHMTELYSSLGSVMSREEEPAFVIRDPRYVKESTNCNSLLYIFNGRLLVGLGVTAFDQLICFPTRLASSCSRPYCQSFLEHRCRRGKDRYLDE